MAREGLLFEVRSAIQKALKTGSSVIRNDISVWVQNAFREIGLEVIPLRPNGNGERFLLVLFHGAPTPELPAKPNKSHDKKAAPKEIAPFVTSRFGAAARPHKSAPAMSLPAISVSIGSSST